MITLPHKCKKRQLFISVQEHENISNCMGTVYKVCKMKVLQTLRRYMRL